MSKNKNSRFARCRACLDIKIQTRIDKVLYYYDAEYAILSETVGLREKTILENINKRLNS